MMLPQTDDFKLSSDGSIKPGRHLMTQMAMVLFDHLTLQMVLFHRRRIYRLQIYFDHLVLQMGDETEVQRRCVDYCMNFSIHAIAKQMVHNPLLNFSVHAKVYQIASVNVPAKYSSGGSRISPRRGRQLPRGAPTYEFVEFSQKLHEIERIWTRGGGASPAPPLDPPLYSTTHSF